MQSFTDNCVDNIVTTQTVQTHANKYDRFVQYFKPSPDHKPNSHSNPSPDLNPGPNPDRRAALQREKRTKKTVFFSCALTVWFASLRSTRRFLGFSWVQQHPNRHLPHQIRTCRRPRIKHASHIVTSNTAPKNTDFLRSIFHFFVTRF